MVDGNYDFGIEEKLPFPFANCSAVPGGNCFFMKLNQTNICIDGGYGFCAQDTLDLLSEQLGDESLDYIIMTHSHYDHILASGFIKSKYPNCKIIASSHCAEVLDKESAKQKMYQLDCLAAKANWAEPGEDVSSLLCVDQVVQDGETVYLNDIQMQCIALPGHTRCCMGYYFPQFKFFSSCETIGLFMGSIDVLPGCVVGYQMTLDSIRRAMNIDAAYMLVSHVGVIGGEDIKIFLQKAWERTEESKDLILSALQNGDDEETIIQKYRDRYYDDLVAMFYPKSAFLANVKPQIRMIANEFLDNNQ